DTAELLNPRTSIAATASRVAIVVKAKDISVSLTDPCFRHVGVLALKFDPRYERATTFHCVKRARKGIGRRGAQRHMTAIGCATTCEFKGLIPQITIARCKHE